MIQTYLETGTTIGNPDPWHEVTGRGWGEIRMGETPRPQPRPYVNTVLIECERLTLDEITTDDRNTLKLSRKAVSARIKRAKYANVPVTWERLQTRGRNV